MKKGGSFFWGMIIGTMAGFFMGMRMKKKQEEPINNTFKEATEEIKNSLQDLGTKIGEKVNKMKLDLSEKWKQNKIKNDLDKIDHVEDELGT
ncbi:YtxH domain-containing protein [Blattabacterium cuenoti]|uniref:YtxH domain-containing protein n=1 Tax=Blattabacterium cuenoti TaxID=1653831 RepID=UPI00163CAD72|nr:YtxH domain-containing protein [Blattabacterium cuenoti]